MKIYNPKPLKQIRVSISKKDEASKYINFIETTQEEVIKTLIKLIDSFNLSVLLKGDRVRVDIRECEGGKNGKSKTISFVGMNVEELYNIIIKKYS
jgi:hypothetical protein